jgi:hypothetical protein
VAPELITAHEEQVARRTLSLLLRSRNPSVPRSAMLTPGTFVHFMYKNGKQALRNSGFVSEALDHFVNVRRQPGSRGVILKVSYEDIRLRPRPNLLKDLDKLEEVDCRINSESLGNSVEEISISDEHHSRSPSDWISEGSIWISRQALTVTQECPARDIGIETTGIIRPVPSYNEI